MILLVAPLAGSVERPAQGLVNSTEGIVLVK
jgi:hypothetical protein